MCLDDLLPALAFLSPSLAHSAVQLSPIDLDLCTFLLDCTCSSMCVDALSPVPSFVSPLLVPVALRTPASAHFRRTPNHNFPYPRRYKGVERLPYPLACAKKRYEGGVGGGIGGPSRRI